MSVQWNTYILTNFRSLSELLRNSPDIAHWDSTQELYLVLILKNVLPYLLLDIVSFFSLQYLTFSLEKVFERLKLKVRH